MLPLRVGWEGGGGEPGGRGESGEGGAGVSRPLPAQPEGTPDPARWRLRHVLVFPQIAGMSCGAFVGRASGRPFGSEARGSGVDLRRWRDAAST